MIILVRYQMKILHEALFYFKNSFEEKYRNKLSLCVFLNMYIKNFAMQSLIDVSVNLMNTR